MSIIKWTALGFAALLVTACNSPSNSSATTLVTAAPSSSSPAATTVYVAPEQSLTATPLFEPTCSTGCALSGDSTAFLDGMTWQTWTASKAVGTGTYKLDDCQPTCAQGTVHPVPVVVTFSQPVKACHAAVRWFWSRASFTFPQGLPKALQGQNAPKNPWDFTTLSSAAQQSCG